MKNSRKSTFIAIANRIVIERGSKYLTLDELAKQAGISKGGVLYHFPSKEALLADMVTELVNDFTMAIEEQARMHGWLMAYLLVSLRGDGSPPSAGALLAAVANNPALLEPLQEAHKTWMKYIEAETHNSLPATEIRLVVDGLWYAELFCIGALKPAERKALLDKLKADVKSLKVVR
jgi:AcrR family transcriptional regulator